MKFTQEKIDAVEAGLESAFDITFAFNRFTLGDDFILSYQYKKKLSVNTNKINIYRYGLGEDALHKNNIFGDNMKTYKFLNDNILILKTFYNKILLNKHFIKKYQ